MTSISEVFEHIAINRLWDSDGSTISGSGSTVDVNKYRVNFLHDFIIKYNITQIIDIPCGDCTWQHTIPDLDKIKYFGADISETALRLAKEKNKKYTHMIFSERPFDLVKDIPVIENKETTLFIIKEVIQHLSLDQGLKMLRNAKSSGAKYIAVTNHAADTFNVSVNSNISPGGFYPNNVFLEPFNFKNPIIDISDSIGKVLDRACGNLIIFNLQEWGN